MRTAKIPSCIGYHITYTVQAKPSYHNNALISLMLIG
jgi:hypothetical protein